jgi:hypothetical protein
MRALVASIEGEFRRYKQLAEDAISQLDESQVQSRNSDQAVRGPGAELADTGANNSIATIVWHVAGNLRSRFTDFLTSDGEKPWRDRDSEFLARRVGRSELLANWNDGWSVLFAALADLDDAHLEQRVAIRKQPLTVAEALHRSLAHVSYHVGQIVYVAKAIRGSDWHYLTIPPGQSAQANENPNAERVRAPRQ